MGLEGDEHLPEDSGRHGEGLLAAAEAEPGGADSEVPRELPVAGAEGDDSANKLLGRDLLRFPDQDRAHDGQLQRNDQELGAVPGKPPNRVHQVLGVHAARVREELPGNVLHCR